VPSRRSPATSGREWPKFSRRAGDIATGATEKGLEITADVVDKVKKPTETEPTETE
jgi:hypothetical protein